MDGFDHPDAQENGDGDATDGQDVNEDPNQIRCEAHAMARVEYDDHWRSEKGEHS